MEDYLETILLLVRRDRVARVRDIAGHMGVAMSSVTAALKSLSERKLVNYDPYEVITLTAKGRTYARGVYRRHEVLRAFLSDVLGMDADGAEANACRMEHAMDDKALAKLGRFAKFLRSCPRVGKRWISRFHELRSADLPQGDRCRTCMEDAMEEFAGRSARGAEDAIEEPTGVG